jgi:hypothetical protein
MKILGGALVAALLGVGGYYGWRQLQLLRQLPTLRDRMSAPDFYYLRNQAWRRLVNSVLMVVMAVLMTLSFTMGWEEHTARLAQAAAEQRQAGNPVAPLEGPDRTIARLWLGTWVAVAALLMVIVLVVAFDVWAIRRYGMRHLRQIQADRNAMLERELANLRNRRNGSP